ncbi:hypothetical protein R76727_02962 [Ralstonia mannitolilytica]|nr:hypothetical protein R76727_02962 [Ralstonia mannitolilytica]
MKAKLFLAGVAMSALSSAAMAQTTPTSVDGVINFQGTILSDTCKVSSLNGDAGTINVDMGKIAADDIGTVAAPKRLTSGAGSANIDVVCKTGAKVSMKFAGKAADLSADKKTLRVNSGNTAAGFAQGVGIAVYEGTGAGANAFDLSNGDLLAQTTVPATGGAVNVRFSAAYVAAELRHKEQWYPAEHPPIIDRELWGRAHAILATNGRVRGNTTRATVPYLLKGIVFGNDGRALSPWHTTKKNGRRYRYYVPQRDCKEYAGASGLPRLPAAELESAVLDQLRAILRAPDLLGEVLPQAIELDPTLDEAQVTVAMTRLDAIWDQLFPAEQSRIVRLLVEKVIVSPNDLEVRLRANGIERLVLELRPESVEQAEEAMA